jgi:hypothetical protein
MRARAAGASLLAAVVSGVPLADFEGEWLAFVRARYAL